MKGRRRRDRQHIDAVPRTIKAGDYWKVLGCSSDIPSNLTGACWYVAAPMPSGSFGLALLRAHTVREEDDGTISVRPGDGSSNSILIKGAIGQQYHGYIEHGVWS